jgi:short-subunit dehydrogenase
MQPSIYLLTGSTGALGQELVSLISNKKESIVILLGRNRTALDQQSCFLSQHQIECRVVICDLAKSSEVQVSCNKLLSDNLIPDFIFNCAGIGLKELAYQGSLLDQLNIVKINVEALTLIRAWCALT